MPTKSNLISYLSWLGSSSSRTGTGSRRELQCERESSLSTPSKNQACMFVQCIVQTQNENKHRQKPRKKRQRRPQIEQLPNEYNECNDCLLVVSLGAFHLGEQRQKKKKKPNGTEQSTMCILARYRPATFRSLCFYKLPTPCSFGTFPSGRHVERP